MGCCVTQSGGGVFLLGVTDVPLGRPQAKPNTIMAITQIPNVLTFFSINEPILTSMI
jgi:hypothetical protein